ncbi:MAG: P1 family peptidase [Eggerthellaceae bacterium]|nr:P1 family peptidase [Eggerthellaceae bacterium]
MIQACSINELSAFRIGHAQDETAATGCTAIIAPAGATCAVDVRGGGPATRETDLLRPENMIEKVHAVVLSGGSAFGLEASCGVMDALAERRIGFEIAGACVPIVVGACLFDLPLGKPTHPDKEMGRAAAETALSDESQSLLQGNIGAGCGATVGKLGAPQAAMKSGLGWTCLKAGDLIVGAIVAVNALGCVCDESGTWIAGVQDGNGGVMEPLSAMAQAVAAMQAQAQAEAAPCTNTTIGAVLTNAKLTKAQATKVASITHDAYARAIKPVHTSNDGDTVFAFASGEVDSTPDFVGVIAAEAMQQAIINAVKSAESAYGLTAARDLA